MSKIYWLERIEKVKLQIEALDQALLAFATDGAKQSVSVDTGQTRISYSRSEITSIQRTIERLLIQLQSLEKKCDLGPGGLYSRPGY